MYLETSFVSACVTTRTDARSGYRRDISREWWDTQRHLHELLISPEVTAELSDPAFPQSTDALAWIREVPVLLINEEIVGLATILVNERVMPAPVAGDAIHVATCCVHRVEYLLSWNVRHMVNPRKQVHLQTICFRAGYVPPQILTPDLLWESSE